MCGIHIAYIHSSASRKFTFATRFKIWIIYSYLEYEISEMQKSNLGESQWSRCLIDVMFGECLK